MNESDAFVARLREESGPLSRARRLRYSFAAVEVAALINMIDRLTKERDEAKAEVDRITQRSTHD